MAKVFDVDDVLLDFINPLLNFAVREGFLPSTIKKSDIMSFDLWKAWNCSQERSMEILDSFYESDDFYNLSPNPGMSDLVRGFSKNDDLYVVSHRPAELEGLTKVQLGRGYGNAFRAIILTDNFGGRGIKSKAEYCKEFGANCLVDDKLTNFYGLNHGTIKIVYNQPWNQQTREEDYKEGLVRAINAEEIGRYLEFT